MIGQAVVRQRFEPDGRDPLQISGEVQIVGVELGHVASDKDRIIRLNGQVRDEFHEYLRLLVEYSGTRVDVDLPRDPEGASFVVGNALQVAEAIKQRLLEIDDAGGRLRVELDFLRRLLPQLRSLLERKRTSPARERDDPPGGEARSQQERYFGRSFSRN